MAARAPAGVDPAGLEIFQEVLRSLMLQRPLEETLGLISRRVCELGEFDFCGIVLPDDQWEHMHLAASHAFPPDYVKRLNELWLAPLGDAALAGSPTVSAIRRRETAVLTDALSDASFRPWRALATEFGYRSLVSAPLVVQGEVLGALNGYSARPRALSAAQLQTVETLASQAALALRLTMLVEAQQETIAELREVNEQLREHRRMLERSHDIHLRLTSAVIAGADFHAVAQTLAGLIGRGVLVTDASGRPICTSEDPPPDPALHAGAPAALDGRIRIGAELLGHVVVEEGDEASRDLDVRAVEHAATVLALEIVKERVARATEERLRSDFLSDLLDGRDPATIGERARHYGLSLGAEHRVVVVALDDWDAHRTRARLSEAGGRSRRAQVLALVAATLAERAPGALTGRSSDAVTAAVPTGGAPDALARLDAAVAACRTRVGEVAPGLALSAGIGAAARAAGDFRASYGGAMRCIDVLRRLGRAGDTLAADDLGILGLFVDSARPDELEALARQVLGPALDHDARTGSALLPTLESYLGTGCDARACARELYVHVNTVRYRLRQVQDLCGLDLRDPQDLLRVTMARLIVRLLGGDETVSRSQPRGA
jgi:PucR-like helix-turn-helix protein/GAF domain-containing protein/diguanylate cyclase with GGDEF domain